MDGISPLEPLCPDFLLMGSYVVRWPGPGKQPNHPLSSIWTCASGYATPAKGERKEKGPKMETHPSLPHSRRREPTS